MMLATNHHTSPGSHYVNQIQESNYYARPAVSTTAIIGRGQSFYPYHREKGTQPSAKKNSCSILTDGMLQVVIEIVTKSLKQIEEPLEIFDETTVRTNSFVDQLDSIKDRFALSITQIAELFSVTRKSVYDWYEGAEPRSNIKKRMETLLEVLSTISAETDLKRLKIVWHIPVSGQSFISVFNDPILKTSTLQKELEKKLTELSSRMTKKISRLRKAGAQLGEAHLAEFDRSADFIS